MERKGRRVEEKREARWREKKGVYREGAYREIRGLGGAFVLNGDYQRLSALRLVDCWMGQRRRGGRRGRGSDAPEEHERVGEGKDGEVRAKEGGEVEEHEHDEEMSWCETGGRRRREEECEVAV